MNKSNINQQSRGTAAAATRSRGDTGQVLPMVAAAIGIVALVIVVVGLLGQRAVARAQARTAADAAALAAAVGGADVGRQIASANGADTVAISIEGEIAVADVTLSTMAARARAEELLLPGADGLAPAMIAAIKRAEDLLGQEIPIVSGFRTFEQQLALFEDRENNPLPVAVPGTSMHEVGLAIDVPSGFVPTLLTVAAEAGLCQVLPATDPIHFELCP